MASNDPEKDLFRLREQIDRLKSEHDRLDTDHLPPEEWRTRLHDWLKREALAFEDSVRFNLSAHRVPPTGHRPEIETFDLPVRSGVGFDVARVSAAGLLAWLLRDTLLERINSIVDEAQYPFGLPAADRPARRSKLNEQIGQLEAQEELAARALETAGREVVRRIDAQPKFVLAWTDDLEARAAGKQPA